MKSYIICLLLELHLLIGINCQLTKEERQILFSKYIKKVESSDFELEGIFLGDGIKYDINKIKNILEKYHFPSSYNFFEDTGKTPKIKNQEKCGSCWAMSATTALSYRYFKKGIDIDFSPQEALSCYIKDCDYGNSILDAQLHLVTNGTITEECLPFSSGDGKTIEECPTTCKDGSEFKRYYAKNTYCVMKTVSSKTFYDMITLIIDQLINDGPVATKIQCYYDFKAFFQNETCPDEVYAYDGISEKSGSHGMVIVGYGFLNDKYYWLIQNSWGEGCDKGLVKIEFGQVGVETICFSEPYIKEEVEPSKEIDIKINSLDGYCNLNISTNSSLDDWKSPLKVIFEDLKGENNFSFLCGVNTLVNETKSIYCGYEVQKLKISFGKYKLKEAESLGKENIFNLDKSFNKIINIYGINNIIPLSDYPIYVSEKGSRITFSIDIRGTEPTLPPIVSNKVSGEFLSCENYNFYFDNSTEETNLIYCILDKDEVDYFYVDSNDEIIFGYNCGYYLSNILVRKLDKTKYPVFRLKHFVVSSNPNFNQDYINSIIIADIEGNISEFKNSNNNSFELLVDIEKESINLTSKMQCSFKSPSKIGKNFIINCIFKNNNYDNVNNYYALPFYFVDNASSPFEVIIKEPIKSIDFIPTPEPDNQDENENKDDNDVNNNLIFIIIISILGLFILILIFIIVIMHRRSKQNDFNVATGPLLNKDPIELK